jgi:hypothetical protein
MLDYVLLTLGLVLYCLLFLVVPVRWTGTATRVVACQWCTNLYGYRMARTVTAFGWAPFLLGRRWAARRAKLRAVRRVRDRLAAEPEPVPCPICGRFQAAAYPAVRRTRYTWLRWVEAGYFLVYPFLIIPTWAALYLPLGGGSEGLLGTLFVLSFGVAAVPGLAVGRLRRHLQHRFHPNRDIPEAERYALARERAVVA